MKIEFCIESVKGAKAAQKHNAHRIELCSNLDKDGLTPSKDLITQCTWFFSGETHIMVRPREGDFVYNLREITQMKNEITLAKKLNVKGVVFGVLTKENSVDLKANLSLITHAKQLGLTTTFHRAFDVCKNPFKTLDQLIDLKFDRILSSGQKDKAQEGINLLYELKLRAKNKIEIMAGSGINEHNAHLFNTMVDAIHFTVHNKNKKQENADYINTKKIEKIKSMINLQ